MQNPTQVAAATATAGDGGGATFTATVTTTVTKIVTGSDNAFGPQYGSSFDFTLLFNDIVLTIIPTVLLITACPFYLYCKRQRDIQVERESVFWGKLFVVFCLFGIQVAQLALWSSSVSISTEYDWGIAAGSLSCFAALCIALLFNTEHRRSIKPSTLLSIYFGITVFLDGAKARSYLLRSGLDDIGAIQVAVAVVKFILLVLEERPKTLGLQNKNLRDFFGKEALSGFWSRSLFLWLNDVFLIGFRRIITLQDLGNLGPEFSTADLSNKFGVIWNKADKTKRFCLVKALFRMHVADILLVIPSRILFSVCSYAQPFLVYHAVSIVGQSETSSSQKHGLIIATVMVYAGIGIFRSIYSHQNNRTAVLINGTLLSQIFAKMLRLPASEAAKGAALTHISADLQGMANAVRTIHDLWIAFFEIGFLTYFLYCYISWACFLLFITASVSTLWAMWFGPRSGAAQEVWNEKITSRVGETTMILEQAKQIKLLGLQGILLRYIQGLRITEIKFSRRFRIAESIVVSMVMIAACFTPVIIIAGALYWTDIPLPLQAGRIFATLTIVSLASEPLYIILHSVPRLHGILACTDRVQDYLLSDDWIDSRSSNRSQNLAVRDGPKTEVIEKEKEKDLPVAQPIGMLNVSLCPAGTEKLVLRNVNVLLPPSSLTIATGASASGKSMFLKALVGAARIVDGHVSINKASVMYCGQRAWLCNGTIKDNIVGQSEFDETWYRRVVSACCLDEDLDQLPQGDETWIGSNGSKLSGGQKHRIAAARAIYPRTEIVVLDDFLSALDRQTGKQIFQNLFGREGLLRQLNTTVVLATHSVQFLDAADVVLTFADKTVTQTQGHGNMDFETAEQDAEESHQTATPAEEPPMTTDVEAKLAALTEKADNYHKGDMSLYYFFLKTFPIWMFYLFLIFSVINTVAERSSAIFMRYWVDHHPDTTRLFPAYAVLGFAPTLTYLAMNILFHQFIVPNYAGQMHRMLVNSMFGATVPYLTSTDIGGLVNRISQDMTIVTQQFAEFAFRVPYALSSVIADIALIAASSYYAILMLPLIFINFYFIQLVYLRTSRQLRLLDLEAKTPLYSLLTEMGVGVEHIRAFNWCEQYTERSNLVIDASQRPHYFMTCIQRWLGLVVDGNNLFVAVILMLFAIYWGATTSKSGIGLAFIGLINLSSNVDFMMSMWVGIETSLGAIARLKNYVRDTPQELDHPDPVDVPESWPERGDIVFDNVSAHYDTENGSVAVLRNVSLRLEGGKDTGFVGRTGSGKSSLFLTLAGGLPYEGSITIDGVELRRVPLEDLRLRITAIPQDTLQLPGTIRQNLMPWLLNEKNPREANQVSGIAIFNVLENTLLADRMIEAGGVDIQMEDFGMSEGEKQLFNIARSMLLNLWYKSKVALMDEVSSNMDAEMDDQIQLVISEAFRNITTCSIAHRTETLKRANAVYRLDDGSVTLVRRDSDPPETLDPSMPINQG